MTRLPDYDRLHFAPAEAQKAAFDKQLTLAEQTRLPLFLHSRAAHADFVDVMRPHLATLRANSGVSGAPSADEPGCVGVVHSFTGTLDDLHELLALGLYVGVNGCSLKTEDSLEVVRQIPLHRIMLETGTLRYLTQTHRGATCVLRTPRRRSWSNSAARSRSSPHATVLHGRSLSAGALIMLSKAATNRAISARWPPSSPGCTRFVSRSWPSTRSEMPRAYFVCRYEATWDFRRPPPQRWTRSRTTPYHTSRDWPSGRSWRTWV